MNTPLAYLMIMFGLLSMCLVFWRIKLNQRQCAIEVCLGLLQLIQEIQRHRGLSMAILNGRDAFVEDIAQTETILAHSLHTLADQYSERHPVFQTTRWQTVLVHWKSLRVNWRQLSFMNNLYAHNEVVLGLLGVLQTITQHQSSLLGPERVKVINSWPVIVEHLGMLRALGMHTLTQEPDISDKTSTDSKVSLAISDHRQQARQSLDLLETRMPDSTIIPATTALLRRVSNLENDDKEQRDHEQWNSQAYYADITGVIDRWYRMMNKKLIGTYDITESKSLRLTPFRAAS